MAQQRYTGTQTPNEINRAITKQRSNLPPKKKEKKHRCFIFTCGG
jgi:hypothetical protein